MRVSLKDVSEWCEKILLALRLAINSIYLDEASSKTCLFSISIIAFLNVFNYVVGYEKRFTTTSIVICFVYYLYFYIKK